MFRYDYLIYILIFVCFLLTFIGKSLEFFCGTNYLNAPTYSDSLTLWPYLHGFPNKKYVRFGEQ